MNKHFSPHRSATRHTRLSPTLINQGIPWREAEQLFVRLYATWSALPARYRKPLQRSLKGQCSQLEGEIMAARQAVKEQQANHE